jgi:hypothetical protein
MLNLSAYRLTEEVGIYSDEEEKEEEKSNKTRIYFYYLHCHYSAYSETTSIINLDPAQFVQSLRYCSQLLNCEVFLFFFFFFLFGFFFYTQWVIQIVTSIIQNDCGARVLYECFSFKYSFNLCLI